MTRSALTFLNGFLAECWRFFNSIYIPGTNVTTAGFAFLILFAWIVVKTIKRLTNNTYHDDGG